MNRSPQSSYPTVPLAFASFILLGLSAGLLGVAWPAIRAEFSMPLEAQGTLLLASTSGYLLASFYSGPLAYRIGVGRMFALGALCLVAGLGSFLAGTAYGVLIVGTFVSGVGSGLIDAGLNAYIAAHHSPKTMNWLHAFFGVGVTIIPLIEARAVEANALTPGAWRWGYALVAGVAVVIMICFALTRNLWRVSDAQVSGSKVKSVGALATLRMPQVWFGILLMFLYAGVEATPGNWGYSLFTEARGMDANTAGFWVSIYWGSFTIGRMFFGTYMPKVSILTLVRACMIVAGIGGILMWWNPTTVVGLVGLMILGFAQAPLFPVLISETPNFVGGAHSQNAIGFQVAGAGLGIAILPSLAGIIAARVSLETIVPFTVVALVLLYVLHEARVLYSAANPLAHESLSAGD